MLFRSHDADALMAIYSDDVQHFEFPSTLVASGAVQVRERLSVRLREPDLHARLVNRIAMGNLVIDQEVITRNFPEPEGIGAIELIAMFEVRGERIVRAWFRFGEKRLRQASPDPYGRIRDANHVLESYCTMSSQPVTDTCPAAQCGL